MIMLEWPFMTASELAVLYVFGKHLSLLISESRNHEKRKRGAIYFSNWKSDSVLEPVKFE